MHPQQARELMARQLSVPQDQQAFMQQGHVSYLDADGAEYFLWVPDDEASLYIYGHLMDISPEVSGELLARAMALNIEHSVTFHGAISLNLQTHQLVLRDSHGIDSQFNLKKVLAAFAGTLTNVLARLKHADTSAKPKSVHSRSGLQHLIKDQLYNRPPSYACK